MKELARIDRRHKVRDITHGGAVMAGTIAQRLEGPIRATEACSGIHSAYTYSNDR